MPLLLTVFMKVKFAVLPFRLNRASQASTGFKMADDKHTGLSRLEIFKQNYPHTETTLLSGADLGVVVAYFIVIISIGIFVSTHQKAI